MSEPASPPAHRSAVTPGCASGVPGKPAERRSVVNVADEMSDESFWDALAEQRAHMKRVGQVEDAMARAEAERGGES